MPTVSEWTPTEAGYVSGTESLQVRGAGWCRPENVRLRDAARLAIVPVQISGHGRNKIANGDSLVVDNLDRLGRTALEVIATVKRLTDEGIVVRSQAQGELDPSTATGRLMIGMFSMLAEFEFDLKSERAAAAREAAAARGQHTGRPRKLATPDAVRARELKEKGMTAAEIGKVLGVSRATIYRYLIEDPSPEP